MKVDLNSILVIPYQCLGHLTWHPWECYCPCFFLSSRRRHTRCLSDWSSDVCSSDLREAAIVDELRFHGIKRLPDGTRDVERAGVKYNFSDVSARLGLEQLARLDDWCRARARLAQRYFECLAGDDLLAPERLPPRDNPGHSWNMFTVLLPLQGLRSTRKASLNPI